MADSRQVDMTNYLNEQGELADISGSSRRLAEYFGSIVEALRENEADTVCNTGLSCRRRPERKPCPGEIHAMLESDAPGAILWECPHCQDRGEIINFRGTPWFKSTHTAKILTADFGAQEPDNEPPQQATFTPQAASFWDHIDPTHRIRLLNNVYCGHCHKTVSINLANARVEKQDLILEGLCLKCGGPVARLVESS